MCCKYLQHDIIEDEAHFLTVCPLYHTERSMLPDATLTLLLKNEYHNLKFADILLSKWGGFNPKKPKKNPNPKWESQLVLGFLGFFGFFWVFWVFLGF